MKRLIVVALFFITTISYAQTATPDPNALALGMYQFEDLTSPQIELSGNWYLSGSRLASDLEDSTATFFVDEYADYLVIHRAVTTTDFGTWSICVDSEMCLDVSDYGVGGGIEPVAFGLLDTNSEIVITKDNNNETAFDFMEIVVGDNAITSPVIVYIPLVATPIATQPSYFEYVEATDEVGETYYIRRDRTITTADEFEGSVAVMSFVVLLVILVVLIWKP